MAAPFLIGDQRAIADFLTYPNASPTTEGNHSATLSAVPAVAAVATAVTTSSATIGVGSPVDGGLWSSLIQGVSIAACSQAVITFAKTYTSVPIGFLCYGGTATTTGTVLQATCPATTLTINVEAALTTATTYQ